MSAALKTEVNVGGFCAHGDKSSGSIKADYFLTD
jgi:hypothetical protein